METEMTKAAAERERQEKRENAGYDDLDKAIANTFPASDPPAPMGPAPIPSAAREKAKKTKSSR